MKYISIIGLVFLYYLAATFFQPHHFLGEEEPAPYTKRDAVYLWCLRGIFLLFIAAFVLLKVLPAYTNYIVTLALLLLAWGGMTLLNRTFPEINSRVRALKQNKKK